MQHSQPSSSGPVLSSRPATPVSSWLISSSIHVIVLGVLLIGAATVAPPPLLLPPHVIPIPLRAPRPEAPRIRQQDSGGGQAMPEPASKGAPPKRQLRMFLPPTLAVNDQPALVLNVGLIDGPLADAGPIGDPSGLLGAAPSLGRGCCVGIGDGDGRGVGDGKDGGFSTRAVAPLKLTRTPQILYKEEPQYSEQARKAKMQGYVRLRIEVGLDGRPFNIQVVQSLGMGLDESAIDAVKRWRFRPALIGDRPVVAPALVEVGFHML